MGATQNSPSGSTPAAPFFEVAPRVARVQRAVHVRCDGNQKPNRTRATGENMT